MPGAVGLVIDLGRDIMSLSKFHEDEIKTVPLRAWTSLIWQNFGQFNDRNSGVYGAIELIEICRDIKTLNIVTKFHEYVIKAI